MNAENSKNPRNKTTGYKGIRLHKNGSFDAVLNIKVPDGQKGDKINKTIYIGNYQNIDEAKKARIEFILLLL